MKKHVTLALLLLLTITTYSQAPKGFHKVPYGGITGDFNGDGKEEGSTNFMVNNAGVPVKYIQDFKGEDWGGYVNRFTARGYSVVVTTAGTQDTLTYNNCEGLVMFANMGNLNSTKGDELAIIPNIIDSSRHSYCHIYSLCNGHWQEVFVFSVHEDAFDEQTAEGYIEGVLEMGTSGWMYLNYLEMPYENTDDVGKMLPLKVRDCK